MTTQAGHMERQRRHQEALRRFQMITPPATRKPPVSAARMDRDIRNGMVELDRRGHGILDLTAEGHLLRQAAAHLTQVGARVPDLTRRRKGRQHGDIPATLHLR